MGAGGTAGRCARGELAGLPRVVWVLAGGSFVNRLGGFVVPFLVLYLVHRGYSAGTAAGAVSAYALGKMAAGPFGGQLTERAGARATTVGSMLASAVCTVALGEVSRPVPILLAAALTGLTSELYRPATSAIMAAEVPEPQRVRAFGVYQLGVSAGTAVGPAIGGLVAERSFHMLFISDAATSLLWAFLAWRTLPGRQADLAVAQERCQPLCHGMLADRRLLRLLAVTGCHIPPIEAGRGQRLDGSHPTKTAPSASWR